MVVYQLVNDKKMTKTYYGVVISNTVVCNYLVIDYLLIMTYSLQCNNYKLCTTLVHKIRN